MRGTTLDRVCNIGRQGIGIGSQEQMDMIGLNSQPENGPMMFLGHLFNDLMAYFDTNQL